MPSGHSIEETVGISISSHSLFITVNWLFFYLKLGREFSGTQSKNNTNDETLLSKKNEEIDENPIDEVKLHITQ